MIRSTVLVLLAGLAGCRTNHLGDDSAVAYRSAFAAQRASDPDRAPTFTAGDAKMALAKQRGDAKDGSAVVPASASILMPAPLSSSTMSGSSGGAWSGAKGNISLEAK
jgi:hypothetical protein